jgi:hypothetical protein
MRHLANLILSVGIVSLVVWGADYWLASHETMRAPTPVPMVPISWMSVAGVSSAPVVDTVAQQSDEPSDAIATGPDEKTANIDGFVSYLWADDDAELSLGDVSGMDLDEWMVEGLDEASADLLTNEIDGANDDLDWASDDDEVADVEVGES